MKLPKPAERIVREVPQLHIPICAGNASFFLLLSLFPLAILLLTILQYIPVTKNDLLALIEMIVPQTLWPFFEYLTNDLYADRSFAILSFSIIATLWSASKGLHSVLYGLNKVAGAEETRPWLHRRLLCMMYTLVTLAALILTLLLNVFGKRILAFLEVHRMLLYVPLSQIMRHTHLYSLALLTLYFCAHSIEKSNKIMMPLFFIIFLILAVRVAMLPGVSEGYRFMFTPRWEALKDPMIWIWAMGQAFFSLSVTGSGMIVYGAYLSKDEDVVGVAQHTALFDTIAAVVAALVIIPACFSYGLDVGAGPSLLFVTLPTILQDIPMGRLFAIILYLAMIFAGVSSLQNMFEAVAESLLHKFPKLSRTAVLAILCVLCLGIGIFMEPISKWGPWMDLVSIYIIPIGATLGAISWFYVMKKDELLAAVNTGSKKERGALWYNVGRFVYVPLAVILCCVALFMHVAF